MGSKTYGAGFVLSIDETKRLIHADSRNVDVVFPYLSGDDITNTPDCSPTRYAICFFDWPLDRSASGSWSDAGEREREHWLIDGSVPADYPGPVAADYPDCLSIIEARVKPERQADVTKEKNAERKAKYWWRYERLRSDLYESARALDRFLIHPLTSKHHIFIFIHNGIIVNQTTVAVLLSDWNAYSLLQSEIHWVWVLAHGNKLETRPQYTNSDVFETFPFPEALSGLRKKGKALFLERGNLLKRTRRGLTAVYNLLHCPEEGASDVHQMRELHVELDRAVARAYGWDDLDLDHGFHDTRQGVRFTISEPARQEVLDRLLALNHERYAEEIRQGLHEKGAKRKARGQRQLGPSAVRSRATQPDLGFAFHLAPSAGRRR
jgi:hypothetical protein